MHYMEAEELCTILCMAYYVHGRKNRLISKSRRWWCRPVNCRRPDQGDFSHLFQELKDDKHMFFKYTRMQEDTFNILLSKLYVHLQKSNWRALSPEQRLIITLRYLATGDQVTSIALAFRIGISTAHAIIKETCEVIANTLSKEYLKVPTEREWKDVSEGYWTDWNLPNCIGALDGKHVHIQAPPKSGSLYFNYKKSFSIVLMAICDYKYKFLLVDVGAYGSDSDAGILSKSPLGTALYGGSLNIPQETSKLPNSNVQMPYYFVADEAFRLHTNVMRPYSGTHLSDDKAIFNYRLSRARRTIENAFGILVSRWRIFRRPICAQPPTVDRIIMACVTLHNFLMTENESESPNTQTYCPFNLTDHETNNGNIIPGTWRAEPNYTGNLQLCSAHRATRQAYKQRDTLSEYLRSAGEVSWQYEYIHRGRNCDTQD